MTKARAKPPAAPPAPVPVEPPAPAAVIADTVPADSVVLLAGTPGSGRSTLLCEWAAAVAAGEPWQGHPTQRRRVLFLDASRERELRDVGEMIDVVADREVPAEWLQVLPARVDLRGDEQSAHWFGIIRSGGYGLILLDALGDLAGPCGGPDHSSWADAVSVFAQRLFDVSADGGSVVLAHTCDVRGAVAGAPLGDGVDVVLRLRRVGGRPSVVPVGPARSGRRRPAPIPPPPPAPVYEPVGSWIAGQYVTAEAPR